MKREIIKAQGLYKSFAQGSKSIEVLSGIDFSVREGETTGIIGASGSGKSTFLYLLAGLDRQSEGEVAIDGQSLSLLSENAMANFRNLKIGFIYQFHHLMPEFSARENIALPALISGKPRSEAFSLADQMLLKLDIKRRSSHLPSELSGGERQRVAIGRSLINNPSLVLADEPTGNLDEENSQIVEELMLDLSSSLETSFVVVTHDESFARRLRKIFVLKNGKLAERTA